ncbi:hypothetical protein C8Q75DRAFT_312454 [Abortiporus biennis]|nr:hypothetical protein C8Q75DRAFT_312454 [Abortiporus biennis]
MSSKPPSSSSKPPRFALYRDALKAISTKTGAPLPSLVFSFAVLHEITAIIPFAGFFFTARSMGIGSKLVQTASDPPSPNESQLSSWAKSQFRDVLNESGKWAERVGSRYGVFGFEKRTREEREHGILRMGDENVRLIESGLTSQLAGDAANAVLAYGLTKMLLPVRIGLSLWLSPAFSRNIVEPVRLTMLKPFRRRM